MPSRNLQVEAGRARPVTAQGKETREAVIRAALRHFSRHGFLEARVEDIVAEAGVAYGTFYKYFHSKRDLVRCMLTDVYDDITARRLAMISGRLRPLHERAYPDILNVLRSFYEHRDTLRVIDVAAGADPELARYMRALELRIINGCSEVIAAQSGRNSRIAPRVAALTIVAAVDETARCFLRSNDLTGDPDRDESQLRELATALTAMCVAVIAPGQLERALAVAEQHNQRSVGR